MFKKATILLFVLLIILGAVFRVSAQQVQSTNAQTESINNIQNQGFTHASIHDIVRDIQQYESWTILQYFDKEDDNTGVRYYRFKLQRYDGKLVIIDVDPMEPDLRELSR